MPATIAKGWIANIDAIAAERAPGVLLVLTHKNMPRQAAWGPKENADRYARSIPQMASDHMEHYGQAVAFVVARSFEQACSAARLVKLQYQAVVGDYKLASRLDKAQKQKEFFGQPLVDGSQAVFDQAFASAAVKVDSNFSAPAYASAAMEAHATFAFWTGDRLTVHCSSHSSTARKRAWPARFRLRPTRCAWSADTSAVALAANCRFIATLFCRYWPRGSWGGR